MRLFAAVSAPAAAYDAVAAALPPAGTAGAPHWTDRALWHVTVAFIGDYDADRVPDLVARLGGAAAASAPFELRFAGAGVFPPRGRPRILWAGLAGDLAALHALADAARDAAVAAGATPDGRAYHPHLTLGTWRPGRPVDADCAPDLASHAGPPFTVTELELFSSHYTSYDRLAVLPLGGAYQA
jgi:RNA 2',3'-cyclic 3'-phosphodiesterase